MLRPRIIYFKVHFKGKAMNSFRLFFFVVVVVVVVVVFSQANAIT